MQQRAPCQGDLGPLLASRAAESSPVCGKSSPSVLGLGREQPHCGGIGVVPCNFVLRERASTQSCLLGIRKSEENHSYSLTIEESKSLKNVGVGIPWGFEGNIYPPDVAEQRRKSQT